MEFPLFGLTVSVHWTTIFLFAIFALDSFLYIKEYLKGKNLFIYLIAAVVATLLVVLSFAVHEAGHAVVANALGFKITDAGIFGLGAYVTNGVSLRTIEPLSEILISFAGPLANFGLALLAVPFIFLIQKSIPEVTLRYFSVINIKLGRMNLWPILFLDGSKVIEGAIRLFTNDNVAIGIVMSIISAMFLMYLFNKKKGRFELEKLIDRIP